MAMDIQECRKHLHGLNLTDDEVKNIQEIITEIVNTIFDELFKGERHNEKQ